MMFWIFAAIALLFVTAERVGPFRAQPLLRAGFVSDVAYVAIHFVLRIVINGTVAVALAELGRRLLPEWSVGALREYPIWCQTAVLIVVLDLVFYVMHRLKHRWAWWWRLHETHHSSVDLDWLAAARFHPLEKVIDRTIFLLPLTVIGASATTLLVWAGVDAFFGMFVHANIRWRLGPLKYVFVGPEMHRWHHTVDRDRQDCNYGNTLSVFDWICGTAYVGPDFPSRFGVDDPDYPVAGLARQFFYAFRPTESSTTAPRLRWRGSPPGRHAIAHPQHAGRGDDA